MKKQWHASIFAATLLATSNMGFAQSAEPRDTSKVTQVQEIRNATVKVSYADTTFLIDPMFAPKGFYEGFPNTYRSQLRNPLVELPLKVETILQDVDAVIVTHTHLDHWDDQAQQAIPKDLPIFVQNQQDQETLKAQGFKDVRVLTETVFEGVKLRKTGGQHGTDAMYRIPELKMGLGETMGVVFEALGHETIYLVGDSIWRPEVEQTIQTMQPDVIILNAGNALIDGFKESIIMGKEDVYRATKQAKNAKVVAVHLDAINHMSLTREQLAQYVKNKGIQKQVLIPIDGETLSF
jgi:L-ascorbate metabolism protein UlaG (beta-lactamase superfamily)